MSSFGLPLALFNIGATEVVLLAIAGLLLFGRRLPEVGKNLGKTIVEFKKGLNSTSEEINRAVNEPQNDASASAPKRLPAQPVKHIAASDEP